MVATRNATTRWESAIYEGRVRHRRYEPVRHDFSYNMMQLWIDLDELPQLFAGNPLWSAKRPAIAWFRPGDFYQCRSDEALTGLTADHPTPGEPGETLKAAILDRVLADTGVRPAGPVRMLAHLRYFGYVFNPVVFYYCYDPSGSSVEAIVAEITNTPWKERHAYVFGGSQAPCGVVHRFQKQFHVSPFFGMDYDYEWSFAAPGPSLKVHMRNLDAGSLHFDSTLELERKPIGRRALNAALLRYPLMTVRVGAAIYWQALRLRMKGVPFHTHPKRLDQTMETSS